MDKSITVYIPTHNRPDFLRRALSSLSKQSYKKFQVGVCDDGSSLENSSENRLIVDEYRNKFDDIFLIRNPHPKGACFARNAVIKRADGNYITGLDDDDEFTSERIQCFVDSWDEKYAYLSSGHITFDGKYNTLSSMYLGKETNLKELLFKNTVGNQIFTLKSRMLSLNGFDEKLPSWQDYDMWVRLTKMYGAGFKVNAHTYILNIGHELNRITTSNKAKLGADMFITKHSSIINTYQLHSLRLQDLINRSADMSLKFFVKNNDMYNFIPMIKYIIHHNYPNTAYLIKKILKRID
ncbi:TPA: glycosyltransferase [Klebsiella pneumoniae]|nr:glycosyltransferase [Klebsiella pneumoniae]